MLNKKKTKIVATIGPATENEETFTKLVNSGLNVARLNFSHGSHEEHGNRVKIAREVSKKLKVPIAVLQDLSGPKIRIGDFTTESVILEKGSEIILTVEDCEGTKEKVSINYPNLPAEVKQGEAIFVNDGKQKLLVLEVSEKEIKCKIEIGGEIKGRRGLNFPDSELSVSSLTEKDKKDAQFGIESEVDFMALSFVRKQSDILELKEILREANSDIKIIAKIETPQAVKNLDEILKVADGVMVARGDLAVEVPAEQVPIIQKEIIRKANNLGKPVITATQMLSSMVNSAVPTRAEVNDIANAILDGTDAVMLSEETTIGSFPVEAVSIMNRVALHTEAHFPYEDVLSTNHLSTKDITNSVSYSVVNTAHELNAKTIVALSSTGFTARMISRYKPSQPILVVTPSERTYNRLALSSNCYPIIEEDFNGIPRTIEISKKVSMNTEIASENDTIIISAGIPFGKSGSTNLLLVQKI